MRARLIVGAVIIGLTALVASGVQAQERCSAPGITDDYDVFFQIAARRWMPVELRPYWCIQKAICVNESRLDPEATSPVGAVGLCQVMPATGEDFGLRGKLRDARNNVKASALAFDRFWNFWVSPRPSLECRLEITIASYNAGPGNIERAQRLSGGYLCWERIRPHLKDVTGKHALETENYVTRFWSTWRRLRGFTWAERKMFFRPSILSTIGPIAIAGAVAVVAALGLSILNDAKKVGALEAAAKRDAITREITLESLDHANRVMELGNAELAAQQSEAADRIAAVEAARAEAERDRDEHRAAADRALALVDEIGECPVPEETRQCEFTDLLPPLPE